MCFIRLPTGSNEMSAECLFFRCFGSLDFCCFKRQALAHQDQIFFLENSRERERERERGVSSPKADLDFFHHVQCDQIGGLIAENSAIFCIKKLPMGI